jgi:hypothetical protein
MSLKRLSGIVLVLTLGIAIVILLTSLATGQTSAQAPGDNPRTTELDRVQKVLDHFKCWTIVEGEPVNRTVFLHDQFDFATNAAGQVEPTFETARIGDPTVFCNATTKIHPVAGGQISAGINDVNDHLTCYGMDVLEEFEHRTVEVRNQFGASTLQVEFPIGLCVPTQKLTVQLPGATPQPGGDFPKNLDHFKCYQVIGQPVNERVELQDQFDRLVFGTDHFEDVDVLQPVALCNPTRKVVFRGFTAATLTSSAIKWDVTAVKHPAAHLVCYFIEEPETIVANLVIRNQFGQQQLFAGASEFLCVPSLKREVGSTGPNP